MAEIRVEKKKGPGWVGWAVGLVAVVLLIWVVGEAFDTDEPLEATAPLTVDPSPVAPAVPPAVPEQPAAAAGIPIQNILTNPSEWQGRNVEGEVAVAEVVSDRGFWITAGEDRGGGRLFVVLDQESPEVKHINAGQRLRLTGAEVRTPADPAAVPGDLDQQAQRIAREQNALLLVDSLDVEILEVPRT